MSPESPRQAFVPPPTPRPAPLVVCLPDKLAISLFIQFGRVIRGIDRSMPDVEHDTQVAFQTYTDDVLATGLPHDLPRLYIFERHLLETDSSLQALAQRVEAKASLPPAAITTTKAGFFNYLHPALIQKQLGLDIEVTDRNDVPLQVAQAVFARERGTGWAWLPPAEQQQRLELERHRLVTRVAPAMTPELLSERKGRTDVTRWLYAIKLNLPRQFFD